MSVTTTHDEGLTIADLEAMPDDGRRYELVGGAIVVTPAPMKPHQRTSRGMFRHLDVVCPPGHEVFYAPIDLDLSGGQRVEPDLVVAPVTSGPIERLEMPVLLVVEIVSGGSRTHDRVTKRAAYAEAGIPAYWIVDPLAGRITCLRLVGQVYEVYAEGAAIDVDWPVSVQTSIDELARG
ncbi:MAG: Uma2 family endonuclease [Acidimicrobiales bacterium]